MDYFKLLILNSFPSPRGRGAAKGRDEVFLDAFDLIPQPLLPQEKGGMSPYS